MNIQEQDEYRNAFNGPAEDAPEGESDDTAAAVTLNETPAEEPPAEEPAPEAPVEEMAAEQAEEPETPEETQRRKSWEGRLKKLEEELRAREAALAERESTPQAYADGGEVKADDEDADTVAEGAGDGTVEMLADGGEAGDDLESIKSEALDLAGDPERLKGILKQMVDDYGRDFVVALAALSAPIIDAKAETYVGNFNTDLEGLVGEIQSAFSSMHKQTIADAHEDFEEVVESPEFQSWIDTMEEADKAKAQSVVDGGSAGQVIKLLQRFKDFLAEKDKPKEPTAKDIWDEDAAASVRSSSPLKIPSRAPMSEDDEYKRAFESA